MCTETRGHFVHIENMKVLGERSQEIFAAGPCRNMVFVQLFWGLGVGDAVHEASVVAGKGGQAGEEFYRWVLPPEKIEVDEVDEALGGDIPTGAPIPGPRDFTATASQ